MPSVRFILPTVKSLPDTRPAACPHCGSVYLHRHGAVTKPIKDLYVREVTVFRYRCTICGRTFRHYPAGVDGHDQSQRLRGLAALSWALGLSLRSTHHLLLALGCEVSRMSVWRDVQTAGSRALSRWVGRARGAVRVLGVDETVVKVRGKQTVVGFVTDAESGALLGMDVLVARDSAGFVAWLRGYVRRYGVRAVVSDDLSTYKPVVERLGLAHQVCLAHVRKNVYRRLGEIAGWEEVKARLRWLLTELPEGGGQELLELEQRVRGEPLLQRLVVALCEKWRSLTRYRHVSGLPATNNSTEQTIGRSKIRYRTLRGYKSAEGMLNGLGLTQWVWNGEEGRELAALLAA